MSARQIRPTGKRLLVKPIPAPRTTASGLHLAEHWQQPTGQAHVIAVGGSVKEIAPGHQVVYSWINGRDVEHDGQLMRLLHQDEVLGLIES